MRFSSTREQLGVSLVSSVMTLIAFLLLLFRIGASITELPLIGHVSHALVWGGRTICSASSCSFRRSSPAS